MIPITKSEVFAISTALKDDLENKLRRLDNNTFLSLKEQKEVVKQHWQTLEFLEQLSDQLSEQAAQLETYKNAQREYETVENILNSTFYKLSESWK